MFYPRPELHVNFTYECSPAGPEVTPDGCTTEIQPCRVCIRSQPRGHAFFENGTNHLFNCMYLNTGGGRGGERGTFFN